MHNIESIAAEELEVVRDFDSAVSSQPQVESGLIEALRSRLNNPVLPAEFDLSVAKVTRRNWEFASSHSLTSVRKGLEMPGGVRFARDSRDCLNSIKFIVS